MAKNIASHTQGARLLIKRAKIMVVARGVKKIGSTKCEINIHQKRKGGKAEMKVPYDSMPPLIRGLFLTKEQVEKLKEPFKDVVSVIRCKDCKYMERLPWLDDEDGTAMVCKKHIFTGMRTADWFCADGERRDDDA